MDIHLLSGFLGSGKTTAIQQACTAFLKKGMRVGVITNDQGIQLVDGHVFSNMEIPERRVVNGCFCCNYERLDESIQELTDKHQPDIIFAESVGSCTDIVATVLKPLLHFRPFANITLTTMADTRLLQLLLQDNGLFEKDVEYIYYKQLEEAGLIVLNKTDLVNAGALMEIEKWLSWKYPGKTMIFQNSLSEDGVSGWLEMLSTYKRSSILPSLDIDYDRYASGEAKMGWLDQELVIRSDNGHAESAAMLLVNTLVKLVRDSGHPIGHLKFWFNEKSKLSFTATTETVMEESAVRDSPSCRLLVNARVQVHPEKLNAMMKKAVEDTHEITGCCITEKSLLFFQPGYPRPLHRM